MSAAILFGATSSIGQATARLWAARGDRIYLVARDSAKLRAVADDLQVRGGQVVGTRVVALDEIDAQAAVVDEAFVAMGSVDVVLVAHGVLGDPARLRESPQDLAALLHVNFVSTATLAERIVAALERQGHGTLAVIGSVAGDRGRQSNYAYGSSKGGIDVFLAGMRHRLAQSPVRVVTIKPGLVDTPMTASFPKGGPLWSSPERVGECIDRAIRSGRDIAYVPGFWRAVMLIIRHLPAFLMHRTKL